MKKGHSMPNKGKKGSGNMGGSGPAGSNHGKSTGLRMEKGTNQGATKKPTTTNRYPNGMS